MSLQGKVAVVTGGGRDIGRAISLRLAREGARVLVNYNGDRASAEATCAAVREAGGAAELHRADVTEPAAVAGLLAAAGERVDVLVNCAGGMVARRTVADMDEAFFDQVMTLNLKSAFLVTKAALPRMVAGSAIVNLSSLAGRDGGGPGAVVYATAKGALMTFTRGLAKELGPAGVRVNAVCPGLIGTSFHDTFSKPEGRAATAGSTALRREGRPEEVAECVAFLASERAAFVTGVCLDVNGGLAFS